MTTTLYQLDSKNNLKVWKISVNKYSDHSEIVVESGRYGSLNLVKNVSQVSSGKNTGKSNQTDHYKQAVSEMESTIKSQIKKGYVENIADAKSSSVLGSGIPAPMLAQKYDRDGKQKGSKTLSQLNLSGKEIIVQPKLDGNRCMIKIENGKAVMYTRKGDIMPVQLEHIIKDLENVEEDVILDGELYSDEISFNSLNGLIKRVKATSEEIQKRKLIKFHLYDIMSENGYEVRCNELLNYETINIVIVPCYTISKATEDEIQKYLELFLSQGHEGLMIRQLGMAYDNKRSWQLLKVKVFEDDEFKLISFDEDVRGGFVGAFVMVDGNGKVFNAGASGQSVEERTEMWNNPKNYLGKMATVCYFGLSEYGVPRFPKFKGVRD